MFRDGELKAIVERQKLKARYSFLRKTGNHEANKHGTRATSPAVHVQK